jgi:hypothetical protein
LLKNPELSSKVINSHTHHFESIEANVFVPRNAAIRVAMRATAEVRNEHFIAGSLGKL